MPELTLYSDPIAEFVGLTWSEFKHHLIDALKLDIYGHVPGRFVFRGQGSAGWGLVASFDRLTLDLSGRLKKERYEQFISSLREGIETHDYMEQSNYHRFAKIDEPLVIEMIGQHFGAPTRILDWSESPYIASFFATCVATAPDEYGEFAIWALDTEALLEHIGKDSCEVISILPSGVDRVIVQQARFTRNKSFYNDLADMVVAACRENAVKLAAPILYKFTIPVSQATEARFDLSLMGIDQFRLFPGLESLCQFAKSKMIASL